MPWCTSPHCLRGADQVSRWHDTDDPRAFRAPRDRASLRATAAQRSHERDSPVAGHAHARERRRRRERPRALLFALGARAARPRPCSSRRSSRSARRRKRPRACAISLRPANYASTRGGAARPAGTARAARVGPRSSGQLRQGRGSSPPSQPSSRPLVTARYKRGEGSRAFEGGSGREGADGRAQRARGLAKQALTSARLRRPRKRRRRNSCRAWAQQPLQAPGDDRGAKSSSSSRRSARSKRNARKRRRTARPRSGPRRRGKRPR